VVLLDHLLQSSFTPSGPAIREWKSAVARTAPLARYPQTALQKLSLWLPWLPTYEVGRAIDFGAQLIVMNWPSGCSRSQVVGHTRDPCRTWPCKAAITWVLEDVLAVIERETGRRRRRKPPGLALVVGSSLVEIG